MYLLIPFSVTILKFSKKVRHSFPTPAYKKSCSRVPELAMCPVPSRLRAAGESGPGLRASQMVDQLFRTLKPGWLHWTGQADLMLISQYL